jgi:hypothetical protein
MEVYVWKKIHMYGNVCKKKKPMYIEMCVK